MNKKTLHLNIKKAIIQSKGRFLSIMSLMALGAFGLVGLKVTGPNIDTTVQTFIKQHHSADFSILADYGLSQLDQDELQSINNSVVEFGYFKDVTIANTPNAVRVFSNTQNLSQFLVTNGRLPNHTTEIALNVTLQSHYQIGDNFSITEYGDNKLLREQTFTVVGFVTSGDILSNESMGIASAGSGTLFGFAVVLPEVFDSAVYTIARMKFDALNNIDTYSKQYEETSTSIKQKLDQLLSNNGSQRLHHIQNDAHDTINDGESKINSAITALEHARQQLEHAQETINTNNQSLLFGEQTLQDKEKLLLKTKQTLTQTKEQLTTTKQQLDEAKIKIDSAQTQLLSNKEQLDTANKQILSGKKNLDNAKLQLDSTKMQLDDKNNELSLENKQLTQEKQRLSLLENQIKSLTDNNTINSLNKQLIAGKQVLTAQEKRYNDGLAAYTLGKQQYDAALSSYNEQLAHFKAKQTDYEQGLNQYEYAYNTFQDKKNTYTQGLKQYELGIKAYEEGIAKYQNGLTALNHAKQTLENNKSKLRMAQDTLDSQKSDFINKESNANDEIARARVDIENAKIKLSELITPEYRVYTRSSMLGGEGYTTIKATSQGITSVGNLFPIVLYAVAALVTMTTMTRFVNEERTNAGILKALGYTNHDVYKKFIVYGLLSSVIGSIIGILAGMYVLPYLLGKSLLSNTSLPQLQLHFYLPITCMALLSSLLCSVIPAWFIAKKELKESAAALLLPKPPAKAAMILLERISIIWKQLSFTQKVTARNIFRYKQRMFMTIFGVAGSLALLFSGLGILSSLNGITSRQYEHIIQYDALVAQKDNIHSDKQNNIKQALNHPEIASTLPIFSKTYTQKIEHIANPQTITLLATNQSFNDYIHLYQSQSKKQLHLVDNGVYITEKIAKEMHVKAGDTITLTNSTGNAYTLLIADIVEMYTGHFIFMNATAYEAIFEEKWESNAYLLKLRHHTNEKVTQIATEFMALDGIQTVVQNTAMKKMVNTLVTSLTRMMLVLTAASVLLAVVILYNLTTINVAERIRELSTIKVLGFYNNEVTLYIYRETIILSLIGILFGLIFGRILHRIIIETVATPLMMFNPDVNIWVYVVPCLIIMSVVSILGYIVNRQLKNIDMLEALKSVE